MCRGLAGMGAPAACYESGRGPRQGMSSEFFRGIQLACALRCFSTGSRGRFLPRFPTLSCCAPWDIPAMPSALPCAAARGDGARRWGFGVSLGIRGDAGSRASEWAGPAAGGGFGFFGELNQAAPCGVSLPGLPADPCRAFQRFLAVPHGTSVPRVRRLSALRSGEGGGGAGMRGFRGVFGGRGVTGSRAGDRLRRGR